MSNETSVTVTSNGEAISEKQFSLGKVYPASSSIMRFNCEVMMEALKASIVTQAKNDNLDGVDSTLEEYCRVWLTQHLGVAMYPLQYTEDGKIDGLA